MTPGFESTRAGGLTPPLLEVRHLVKYFVRKRGLWRESSVVKAVDDLSFAIREGEMFGLVGESGSGKSTTGRCILRLVEPSSGEVLFRGDDVLRFSRPRMRRARRDMQIVFQDPYSSLNPRMRAGDIVEEPLIIHELGSRAERRGRVADLFDLVGLDPDHLTRYPHEFSGGQRQRIGIARALALNPALIIADEAVSRAGRLHPGAGCATDAGVAGPTEADYLFIAHDLRLVEHICSRVR